MPAAEHRPRAARGHLARLVVVVALLAGVATAIGVHCADDLGNGTDARAADTSQQVAVVPEAHHDQRDSHGEGGLVITCLVFLIAVITAMSKPHPGVLRALVDRLRSAGVPVPGRVLTRAPRLAELCLLRV